MLLLLLFLCHQHSPHCLFNKHKLQQQRTSHLRPVAVGGEPLRDLGDRLLPRLTILSAHEHGLVELEQG